jgi:hypothetical protein
MPLSAAILLGVRSRCGRRTVKRLKGTRLGNTAAMMHYLRTVNSRGSQWTHEQQGYDVGHPTPPIWRDARRRYDTTCDPPYSNAPTERCTDRQPQGDGPTQADSTRDRTGRSGNLCLPTDPLTLKFILGIKLAKRLECGMPLDLQECRRQALACIRLAQTSISPQASRHYAELAKTWLTIAGDLAELESQLNAKPEKKTG